MNAQTDLDAINVTVAAADQSMTDVETKVDATGIVITTNTGDLSDLEMLIMSQ